MNGIPPGWIVGPGGLCFPPKTFYRQTGWIANGPAYMGGRTTISPTRKVGELMSLPVSESEAPITATLSFASYVSNDNGAPAAGSGTNNHLPRIYLSWGSHKGKMQAVFDLLHGVRVVVEGSTIECRAQMDFIDPDPANQQGPTLDVYMSIGDGDIGRGPGLTFTSPGQALDVETAATFSIPLWAKSVEVHSSSDPNAAPVNTFDAEIKPFAAVGAATISRFATLRERVQLPNGAEAIQITNLGPDSPTYTPIFHLEI